MSVVDRWVLVVGVLVVLLVAFGWYLSFTAARLDRLHHKVEAARAGLDLALVRRAQAAVAVTALLDPASGLLLADAAAAALFAGERDGVPRTEVEQVESDLTRALAIVLGDDVPTPSDRVAEQVVHAVVTSSERVQMARRFHNEAVAQAQRVRRKRIVRWAHLAGHAAMPATVELDDDVPGALRG